jgi:transcriptional regulator with XRE-family HTH domain
MMSDGASSIAVAIKQELARRRMSRAALAADAKVSLSALEKGLSGKRKFSDATLVRLEQVLGLSFRVAKSMSAPDWLGGYARPAVTWLENNYLTIRPSSKRPKDLYAYVTDVTWNDERGHLVFKELARVDKAYAQWGDVAVPHQTGHIYFTTNRHGQHRLMVMKRQARTGELFGLLLTLQQERGAHLMPVSMPVVMVPIAKLTEPPALGAITENNKAHEGYARKLSLVLEDRFAGVLGV